MKPIACLGCLTAAANQTCRKSWFSREKKAVTADSRHFNEKKTLWQKSRQLTRAGSCILVQLNPNKKENNPPISSEHLFFSSRFSYYPQAFYFGTPISPEQNRKTKTPLFWFYHLRSWWKKKNKIFKSPLAFFCCWRFKKVAFSYGHESYTRRWWSTSGGSSR